MHFSVMCDCGRTQQVLAAEAGSRRSCECGKELVIPSLRALRQTAGLPVTETPELLVKVMLQEGRLPDGDECASCSVRTDDVCYIWADCEKKQVRWSGGDGGMAALLVTVLFGPLFGWLTYKTRRSGEAREIGGDLTYRLPLRLCARCARRLRGSPLKQAVHSVPLYDRLLQKYPRAKLSTAGNEDRPADVGT